MQVTKNKKRVAGLAIAGLLVSGAAGIGANWSSLVAISNNTFTAQMDENGTPPIEVEGAKLVVTGDAVTKDFAMTTFNETVTATWTITNEGTKAADFAAQLNAQAGANASLGGAVQVWYQVKGADTWVQAGNLTTSSDIASVTGSNFPTQIAAGASEIVNVRFVLVDPSVLAGEPNETLTVKANFDVGYTTVADVPAS